MNEDALKAIDDQIKTMTRYVAEVMVLTALLVNGLKRATFRADILDILAGVSDILEVDDEKLKQSAAEDRESAEFAKSEIANGFPFIHGLIAVAVWGRLEAFIEDIVVTCLEHDTNLLQKEQVRKVKVSLADYESLTDSIDRRYFLTKAIQKDLQSSLKQGVAQFEGLLNAFGMGGAVEDEDKRTLFELSKVRNVILHRNSVVDKQFIDSCPWLGLNIRDEYRVTNAALDRYLKSVLRYSCEVTKRILIQWHGDTDMVDRLIKRTRIAGKDSEH